MHNVFSTKFSYDITILVHMKWRISELSDLIYPSRLRCRMGEMSLNVQCLRPHHWPLGFVSTLTDVLHSIFTPLQTFLQIFLPLQIFSILFFHPYRHSYRYPYPYRYSPFYFATHTDILTDILTLTDIPYSFPHHRRLPPTTVMSGSVVNGWWWPLFSL